ncbi:MAG: hypothetical protein KF708_15585 [Pirellulales bacterium]|nr:hypothetical protein [Pirellulales bacterium]
MTHDHPMLPAEHDATTASSARGPVASGKYAIVTITVLAVGLASAALYYQYYLQQRPLEFWGTEIAQQLLSAPQVELLLLEPVGATPVADGETYKSAGRTWRVREQRDVSQAPGFTHVRRSLILTGSFDWDAPRPEEPIDWRYALVYRSADPWSPQTVVLFSAACDVIELSEPLLPEKGDNRSASVLPVADGLRAFLEEQVSGDQPAPETPAADGEPSAAAESSVP